MTSPTPSTHGPELLDERSIGGILVHPLALMTGVVGAVLVYAASNHEYTRANARRALNWHLSVLLLSVLGFVTFFLGADELTVAGAPTELSLLPGPLDTIVGLVGFLLLFAAMISWLLTFLFAIVATVKAVFGTAWTYPGSIDIVGRYT